MTTDPAVGRFVRELIINVEVTSSSGDDERVHEIG